MWARVGERVIVGNLETGSVVSLDGTAADMWEALVSDGTESAVVDQMSVAYDVDVSSLRDDVAIFVADLQRRGHVI